MKKIKAPFSMIPNHIIRNNSVDQFAFRIFCCIASCGKKAFPSYETLMTWSGMSRDSVNKSLRKLEKAGLLERFKKDQKVFYKVMDGLFKSGDFGCKRIKFKSKPVRNTDSNQSATLTLPVRQTDPNYNSQKEHIKKEEKSGEKKISPLGTGSEDELLEGDRSTNIFRFVSKTMASKKIKDA